MKRQAVIVIHGIGEQKPMSTLRGFVESVSDYSKEKNWVQVYNIPDTYSNSYELRQLALYYGKDLRSDFFEYYWAYNMRGTKASAVGAWLLQLIFRKPGEIPKRIRWIYFLIWLIGLTYLGLFTFGGIKVIQHFGGMNWIKHIEITKTPFVILAGTIIMNILTYILTMYLGDAARYTYAAPGNVEERNKIRKGGIDLLDKLHKSGKYSRIIVVGHSLGSMIGYDIVKHYWAQVYKDYQVSSEYPRSIMDDYNAKSKTGFDLSSKEKQKEYLELQCKLFDEQKMRKNPWLVTDFVTMGNPLAYGELLMAESKEAFGDRKEEREFPTNPPVKERSGGISYSQPFDGDDKKKVPMDIIHHSGLFAFTRWHNMYYKMDFVGGPVRKVFGEGIIDREVKSSSWKARIPFLMHTNYWGDNKSSKEPMKESIECLKSIILKNSTPS